MSQVTRSRLLGPALVAAGLAVLLALAAVGAEAPPAPAADARPASKIIAEGDTYWSLMKKGGWCMWFILGCSIVGMTFFIERFIELRRRKHLPKGFDKDLLHLVDTRGVDAGLALCLERQSSLSRVLYAALLRYGTSRQEMEASIQDEGGRLLYDLRRNCRWVGLMGSMAPLWGLLGTVLGLIQCFDALAAAHGPARTEALGTGVAVALLTTAFGLLVAIPLLLMHHWVRGKADDTVREIEERAVDVIITLDRKARRSMRLVEDVEENLETKAMTPAAAQRNLDAEFEDQDLERSIKTSVTTPAQPLAPAMPAAGRAEGKSPASGPRTAPQDRGQQPGLGGVEPRQPPANQPERKTP